MFTCMSCVHACVMFWCCAFMCEGVIDYVIRSCLIFQFIRRSVGDYRHISLISKFKLRNFQSFPCSLEWGCWSCVSYHSSVSSYSAFSCILHIQDGWDGAWMQMWGTFLCLPASLHLLCIFFILHVVYFLYLLLTDTTVLVPTTVVVLTME